jgi:putative intracellular protease/amidase
VTGKTIAFLVANEGVEPVELRNPWQAQVEAGGRAVLAAPNADDRRPVRPVWGRYDGVGPPRRLTR